MQDRSFRPHTSPTKTPKKTVQRIISLRLRTRLGPLQLGVLRGVAPSTAHQILRRCRLGRLSYTDRATGEVIRCYEHDAPVISSMSTSRRSGRSPMGVGGVLSDANRVVPTRAATPGKPRNAHRNPKMGHCFVHTVIDDPSRVAYAEIHDDEKAVTVAEILE